MRFRRGSARPKPGEWLVPEDPHPVGVSEAAEVVLFEAAQGWDRRRDGELILDPDGPLENNEVYVFNYGAREFLVDGDTGRARAGYPLAIVRKADGALTWYLPGPPPLSDFDEKFPDLRPVLLS